MSGSPEEFPGRLLHQTCIYNNYELLDDLMKGPERENIDALDAAGRSVVYSAVSNTSFNCLRILLENGADPNLPCKRYNGQTPLHQAAIDGRLDLIKLLLAHSADYSVKDKDGNEALDYARQQGHTSCVKLLTDTRDEVYGLVTQDDGVRMREPVVKRLVSRRLAISSDFQDLHHLKEQLMNVAECNIDRCNELADVLERQKVIDIVNSRLMEDQRITLLYRACILNRVDLVRWLIEHGARDTYDLSSIQTPLYGACHEGNTEVVRVLLQHFPHLIKVVTSTTVGKLHCLHLACVGSLELLKLLMEWDYPDELLEYHYTSDRKYYYRLAFDINIANVTLWSPLYLATASDKAELVRYLLQYEVMGYPLSSAFTDLSESDIPQALTNIEEYRDQGMTPRKIRPVDVEQSGVDSLAPLHHASKHGSLEVAKLLIEHQADVNQICEYQERGMSTPQKYTPLKFAVRKGDKEMISLLLKSGARDENSEILGSCLLENNNDIAKFLLKHHAHPDTQHKITLQHSAFPNTISRRGLVSMEDFADGPGTANDVSVSINWRTVKLPGAINEDWLYECGHYINPHIPREISVETITVVDISDTGLASLPHLLFTLKHLVSLNAQSNKLQTLPPSQDWTLPNLKELFLDKNKFSSIPDAVFYLPALERLSMSYNSIRSVQHAMYKSPKLADINLSHNEIEVIAHSPAVTTESDNLGDAVCMNNTKRRTISEEYVVVRKSESESDVKQTDRCTSQTSQSKTTVVNHWSDVLEVVDVFEGPSNPDATLTSLNFSHNRLNSVPQGLPCLASKLQKLDFSYNEVTTIGSPAFYPYSLISLNLAHNKIKHMILDLDEMDETNRQIVKSCYSPSPTSNRKQHRRTGSSASIADTNMPRNRSSNSSMSSQTSLALNAPMCRHKAVRFDSLTTLNLSYNKLTELQFSSFCPNEQAEAADNHSEKSKSTVSSDSGLIFPRLTHLDLSHNNVKVMPSTISEHTDLSQLNLRFNLIQDLPPEMGLLKSLWNMELSGCPLEGPLAEMVQNKSKTSDVLGFLKSVLHHAKPYASMKLMIVGEANIGKTSLLAELRKEGKSSNPFKHFNQRVSNSSVAGDSRTGDTVSTVGVDIGDLTFDRSDKKGKGKVVFKTWDFGGQEEYYATHQYFLSKRSLYLVLFKLTDGEQAVNNIKQWLVNIQTRSPGAPVLIVGSHFDLFKKNHKNYEQKLKDIKDYVSKQYMIPEPSMSGLPNVKGFVEVSARSRYNIATLYNKIYEEAWALRAPATEQETVRGSTTMALLEQKIPAIYIQLEQVIGKLAEERLAAKKNPVLNAHEYRALVKEHITFRDDELNQATQFLHDNGVLLHYHDVALNDLYFLDPQWLCDMLAHVITIKQINGFVKCGIMKRQHLQQLFGKSSIYHSDDLQSYIISLLNKFELALVWDYDNLLLPSLLPTEHQIQNTETVKLPIYDPSLSEDIPLVKSSAVRRRATINSIKRQRRPRYERQSTTETEHFTEEGKSTFYVDIESSFSTAMQQSMEIPSLENSYANYSMTQSMYIPPTLELPSGVQQISSRTHESIRRIYLLSYIPSGFWPRLISRIYRDQTISILSEFLFDVPADIADIFQSRSSRSWQCWKTGLSLQYVTSDLLKVKEVHRELSNDFVPYYQSQLYLSSGRKGYSSLDISAMNVIEVEIPDTVVEISQTDSTVVSSYFTNKDIKAKLLAKVVEHIETLLEDWYPDLGEKFQHTSRGKYLVQRLVVCPSCLERWHIDMRRAGSIGPTDVNDSGGDSCLAMTASSRKSKYSSVTFFTVESLLTKFYDSQTNSKCKEKHSLDLNKYAPDLIFADILRTLKPEDVVLGKALGKGAYGVVFSGTLRRATNPSKGAVAVKSMQPHDPGEDASDSLRRHYEQGARKWNAEPSRNIFTAYCNARQEINILSAIQHPNIVSLVGVLLTPLSLLLERAPCGSLQDTIEEYSRVGLKIPFTAIQQVVIQIASALDYLHNESESRLIYRDLKAENVLVWSMTYPHIDQPSDLVDVRLADFGVSRAVSDNTAKGIRGTPGYIAPEILEFQGKEQYTNKVDCYSFGSFLYELITLKRPFYNADGNNIASYVLAGKHPNISSRELLFPTAMLDLMTKCWSYDPKIRPSAEEMVMIASDPQFSCLQEAVKCDSTINEVTSSCLVDKNAPIDMSASLIDVSIDTSLKDGAGYDVYVAGGVIEDGRWSGKVEKLMYSSTGQYLSTESCELPPGSNLIVCCAAVDSGCWLADKSGYIHILMPKTDSIKEDVETFLAASPLDCGLIKQLLYAEHAQRVFCLLQKGLLIEYDSRTHEKVNERRCSFENTNCMVLTDNSLWIGERNASISILPVHELVRRSSSASQWMSSESSHTYSVNHFTPVEQLVDTASLVTDREALHVWSSVYPGSCIYKWDVRMRCRVNNCDVSRVVMNSEELESDIDAPISCLAYHSGRLLVSTTTGYLVILDSVSMTPLVCMKPHLTASYRTIHSLLPLPCLDKYLTVGVSYKNLLKPNDNNHQASTCHTGKPPIHVISWYIDPSESQ